MPSLRYTRLSPALGAVVEGIDLAQHTDADTLLELRRALLDYQVLFFRDQTLDPRRQRDFAASFGELHIHPLYPHVDTLPELVLLDTERNDLRDNALWHTDVTFIETPPLGAVLAARLLPANGGDTLWASGSAAWEGLSARFRDFLDGLSAVHDFGKSFPLERFGHTPEALANWERTRRTHPPVVHPVVRTHPETGRKALFVSEGFTTRIVELSPGESEAVLGALFRHFAQPQYTIRWRWREGDVAFWDNRATQHYAVDDYRPARRVMHRATILGDRPY
jgi:taurine dioxygenase